MKLLFLDDEQVRHELFSEAYDGHEIWHVYTLDQFKRALDRCHQFDVVSFDHDLGVGFDGHDCAKEMLRRLPENRWPLECWVHSWNPTGARRIFDTLHEAGIPTKRLPFSARRE